MCLGVNFFGIFLFGVAQLVESLNLYLMPNLGDFWSLFL